MAEQRFRWQALFQRADEPLFVLSRKRSLVFVNLAWEKLTGLAAADARHLPCRRRQPASSQDSLPDILSHILSPPPEVLEGQSATVRRIIPSGPGMPRWWDIEFTPLRENNNLLLVFGRIRGQPIESIPEAGPPLPERLLTLRLQAQSRLEMAFPREDTPFGRRLASQIRLAASVTTPVILVGEPGTGKRTLARLLHKRSHQAEKAIAVLDCEALPATVIADMLWGTAWRLQGKQLATIYLREPGALPREIQQQLVERLSESGTTAPVVLPRYLAGFDGEPHEQIGQGKLLESLFCSLAPLRIDLQPLRLKLAELPLRVEQILQRLESPEDKKRVSVSAEVLDLFRKHPWPGNFTELIAVLDESRARAADDTITLKDLPYNVRVRLLPSGSPNPKPPPALDTVLEQVERRLIELTLERCRGNKSRAADELGMSRARFLRRLEHFALIDPPLLDLIEE